MYLQCARGADPDDSYRSPACHSLAGSDRGFRRHVLEPLHERRLREIHFQKSSTSQTVNGEMVSTLAVNAPNPSKGSGGKGGEGKRPCGKGKRVANRTCVGLASGLRTRARVSTVRVAPPTVFLPASSSRRRELLHMYPDAYKSGACARCVEQHQQQWPHRYYWVTFIGGRVSPSPARRRLTACVIAGCVGHASVHCDCGPRAWGSGVRARCVFHSSSSSSSPAKNSLDGKLARFL